MKLSEVSTKVNLTNDTIRYYEKVGLLTPSRNKNKRSCYDTNDIKRLEEIKVLRSLGMSISEIGYFLKGTEALDGGSLETADAGTIKECLNNLRQIQRKILRKKEYLNEAAREVEKCICKLDSVIVRNY